MLSIADADHICRLIHTAHQLSLVPVRVWVAGIEDWIVAGLPESTVGTVGAIDCIKERVKDAVRAAVATLSVVKVVSLVESRCLGVDDRDRKFKVEVAFAASLADRHRCHTTIDGIESRVSARRNFSDCWYVSRVRMGAHLPVGNV